MATKDNALRILDMSVEQRDNLLKTMTSQEFIESAKSVVTFVKDTNSAWTKEDKQIMDTCESMLREGKTESFEERKYFMETMKDIAAKIDKKKIWTGLAAIGGVGLLLWALAHKK